MQATGTLAEQLHAVWLHLARDSTASLYALLEELGLGLTQVKSLDALDACDCEPTVKELSERLGLSLPGTSRNVDGLLRRGFVERREDEQDRRQKRLSITPAGREVVDRIASARLAGLEAFVSRIPADQREDLTAALEPIVKDLG